MTDNKLLTISIVTFNNVDTITAALESINNSTIASDLHTFVLDNGSSDDTTILITTEFPEVTLMVSDNVGFGSGHNKVIEKITGQSKYHLIMNPDISFAPDTLQELIRFMDTHPQTGLVMPAIQYPDQTPQYLCKLLPTPFDLIFRRFLPGFLKPFFKGKLDRYEMKHKDFSQTMEVPHLSGCFMLIRNDVFKNVGLFDQRFFMYLEDVDFSRRIHAQYKTLFYPGVHVTHHYHKGSYKRLKHLKYHITSAVRYFNKWGWFHDRLRRKINRAAG